MNAQTARVLIVIYSLALTGFLMIFLSYAPFIGVPFNEGMNENVRLVEIVLPVFLGYLGSASHFIFNANRGRDVPLAQQGLFGALLIGSLVLFTTIITSLFVAFWAFRDSPAAMDFDSLSRWFSMALGLLAVTVSVLSSYLFGAPPRARKNGEGSSHG